MGWFTNDASTVFPAMSCGGYEKIVVSSTVMTLAASKLYITSSKRFAEAVAITVETDNIRLKMNGDDPSDTDGLLVAPGAGPLIINSEENLKNLKMICQTSDATVQVIYFYGPTGG